MDPTKPHSILWALADRRPTESDPHSVQFSAPAHLVRAPTQLDGGRSSWKKYIYRMTQHSKQALDILFPRGLQ